jgi:hypothetical protein
LKKKRGGAPVTGASIAGCRRRSIVFHSRSWGPNVGGIDPAGGKLIRLYHPRRDRWEEHFQWAGATLMGLSVVGRVTIRVLAIDDPDDLAVRQALLDEGVFP